MIQLARKRLLIAAVTLMMSGVVAVPAQAGIIPWIYDGIFGPVGSIRANRMGAGYGAMYGSYGMGMGGCGVSCNPCAAPSCNPCGGASYYGGGIAMGGVYGSMGGCSSGNCSSGSCGVYFTPDATPSNIAPRPDTPPASPNTQGPRPTFNENSNNGRTNVTPGYGASGNSPGVAPGDFSTPPAGNNDSAIGSDKKGPARARPSIGGDDGSNNIHPTPLRINENQVTWSSRSELGRQASRTLGSRSVQVVRQGSFSNSKWEVAKERHEVAKK